MKPFNTPEENPQKTPEWSTAKKATVYGATATLGTAFICAVGYGWWLVDTQNVRPELSITRNLGLYVPPETRKIEFDVPEKGHYSIQFNGSKAKTCTLTIGKETKPVSCEDAVANIPDIPSIPRLEK